MIEVKIPKTNEKIVITPGTLPKPIEDIYNKLKDYEQIGTPEEFRELKKKEEPIKPKIIETRLYTEDYCPICNEVVEYGSKYCGECGQKLDWEGFE